MSIIFSLKKKGGQADRQAAGEEADRQAAGGQADLNSVAQAPL